MTSKTSITANFPNSANGHFQPTPSNQSATQTQVGGDHYAKMAIQPAEFIMANKLGWAEGCAIGYISRWREKNGVEDLRKAIHTLELLIEHESKSC